MNPARSLGPALLSGVWNGQWLYFVAPLLGAALGALLYHWLHQASLFFPAMASEETNQQKLTSLETPEVQDMQQDNGAVVSHLARLGKGELVE
jgi:hypothetical protein